MENKQPQTAPADVRENIMGTMDINPLLIKLSVPMMVSMPVSYTHLRAHETDSYLVCRLLLEKKKTSKKRYT